MQSEYSKLIIVCAHAVFHGSNPLDESSWALQPFQRGSDTKLSEHFTFLCHIEESVRFAGGEDESLIVFTGGATKPEFPHLSEAHGYMNAAMRYSKVVDFDFEKYVVLEEYATDTFQNIFFSVLKFYEVTSKYPLEIIVITHDFKKERVELHRDALKWTRPFIVQGIDPEFEDDQERQLTRDLERRNATEPYRKDPYGVRPPLSTKRVARRWDESNLQAIGQAQPDVVQRLLCWKGGESGSDIFPEHLPWNEE